MEHHCFVCGKDIDGKVWSELGVCKDCIFDLGANHYIYTKLAKSIRKEDRHGNLKEHLSNAVTYIICFPLLFLLPLWLQRWIASDILCLILGLVLFVGIGVLLGVLQYRLKDAWDKTGRQAEESRVRTVLKENETLYYAIKNCEDITPYIDLMNQRSVQAQKEYQTNEKRKDIVIKIIAYCILAVVIISVFIKK